MTTKFAVLLYGLEKDKAVIGEIMKKLQMQLNQTAKDEVDVVFYTDNGEMSIEEKKSWLIGQTTSKYYSFVNPKSELPDNFIIYRLNAVKQGKPTKELIDLGVFRKDVN